MCTYTTIYRLLLNYRSFQSLLAASLRQLQGFLSVASLLLILSFSLAFCYFFCLLSFNLVLLFLLLCLLLILLLSNLFLIQLIYVSKFSCLYFFSFFCLYFLLFYLLILVCFIYSVRRIEHSSTITLLRLLEVKSFALLLVLFLSLKYLFKAYYLMVEQLVLNRDVVK